MIQVEISDLDTYPTVKHNQNKFHYIAHADASVTVIANQKQRSKTAKEKPIYVKKDSKQLWIKNSEWCTEKKYTNGSTDFQKEPYTPFFRVHTLHELKLRYIQTRLNSPDISLKQLRVALLSYLL